MLKAISLVVLAGVVVSSPISKHGRQIVKDNCVCLEQTKFEEDGGVQGEYSYVDPVGSRITVTYIYDQEGTYNEKRRIDKTFGGMQTVIRNVQQGSSTTKTKATEQSQIVLKEVIQLLDSTISTTVKELVQENSDSSVATLLQKVSFSLRPLVRKHVVTVVKQQGFSKLDTEEIVSLIIEQLSPALEEQIQQVQTTQITSTTTTLTNSESDIAPEGLITRIVSKLQPIITETVEETYGTKTTHFRTTGSTSDAQPVVSQVTTTIDSSHSNIDQNKLVSNIVSKVTPIITETLEVHEEQIEEVAPEPSTDVVETIVTELQPSIQATLATVVTEASSSSSNNDLADLVMQQLRTQITEAIQSSTQEFNPDKTLKFELEIRKQLRHVILATITAYRATVQEESSVTASKFSHSLTSTSESEFSSDLVTTLVSNMQPYILEVVTSVLSSQTTSTLSNDALVELIIQQLDNKIDDAIVDSATGFTEEKNRRLHQQIVLSLKPVIQAAINPIRSIQTQQILEIQTKLLSPEFAKEVVEEIEKTTESVVEETFARRTINIESTTSLDSILEELKPKIEQAIRIIIQRRQTQVPSNFFESEAYYELLNNIIEKVKVLVTSLISEMRESETILVNQVVEDLKANIPSVVNDVIQKTGKQDKTSIMSKVTSEVTSLIQTRLPSDASEFQIQRWTRLILEELQIVIRTEIETQSQTILRQSQMKDEEIVDQAVTKVQTKLPQIIMSTFESNPSNSGDAIYLKVVQEIRSSSVNFLPSNSSPAEIEDWLRMIVLRLESTIRTELRTFTTSRKAMLRTEIIEILFTDFNNKLGSLISDILPKFSQENASESVVFGEVQRVIRSRVKSTLQQLILTTKYSILGSSEVQIIDEVMSQLQESIERIFRIQIQQHQGTISKQHQATISTVKSQSQTSKLTSIFGTSGLNTVRVGTPTFQYGYEH